jgi:RHH-type proline utilization regulon transcriptional repressor/proline dehydrogenase/delta 1-pyrroline-5-carboxylate dehydrogenase
MSEHAAPAANAVDVRALQEAINDIDSRNWSARPDRVTVLRKALSGCRGATRKALAATAGYDMEPHTLPGPTGESNHLRQYPKGVVLCLGPTTDIAVAQAVQALGPGCGVVIAAPGGRAAGSALLTAGAPVALFDETVAAETLAKVEGISAVAAAGASDWTRLLRQALAGRPGAVLPLETQVIAPERFVIERHLCIDTTAAGGNASLLASAE